jgi:hypothetical protein
MADLSYPGGLTPAIDYLQGAPLSVFSTVELFKQPFRLQQDLRHITTTTGVISDRVMLRTGPSTDIPFANGRIWLLRLTDGYKAWEGLSDSDGYYTATGLELGVEYIAVGIDPVRNHKATGAGPVAATLPAP